ncbi:MAG: type II toxin-antitoxin system VapC family toxin [Rhizobiaceae bacterium]|nr:type II toxin-antitoxin system VapC family toxin [Rhizobiaceae bacterium]
MATLIDTNILIDVFHRGSAFEEWSALKLEEARRAGAVIINPIIYAEMAAGYATSSSLEAAISPTAFEREDLPWDAAYAAGQAFLQYKRAGGEKRSPLPDFYIGAHAAVRGYRLLTRDPVRYRGYFPMVSLISPETHP